MSSSFERAGVVPATLSFLAIYNPTLSSSDETFEDQVLYYYSRPRDGAGRRGDVVDSSEVEETKEEKEEKLRQIGLAQGMVSFAKNFSNGKSIDSIETEKSRIILHELETDFWLLASIDLTRLPTSPEESIKNGAQKAAIPIEYSAREVCPPALLVQQILRAHHIFLIHQAQSIAELLARVPRPKFCGFLKRFWDVFVRSWDVLLHGNPAVDIFNGLKLAAGGELGIGVGEEEWGSGEREVLEGFVGRTEGLVDLVVSRFGDVPPSSRDPSMRSSSGYISRDTSSGWQFSSDYPKPSDGIVFSGIGALSRHSVRNISSWMEWLHMHGQDAYGVRDNPSSAPRRKRRKIRSSTPDNSYSDIAANKQRSGSNAALSQSHKPHKNANGSTGGPRIPPSIVALDRTRPVASASSELGKDTPPAKDEPSGVNAASHDAGSGTDTFVKYLTLGVYGSTWGIPSGRPPIHRRVSSLRREDISKAATSTTSTDNRKIAQDPDMSRGYFLIGLQGDLEEGIQAETVGPNTVASTDTEIASESSDLSNCVVMRRLHVERVKPRDPRPNQDSLNDSERAAEVYFDHVRVVVYVQEPFIFTFLFELQTVALAIPSFYRSLHHQLGPLQRPLLASTSPSKVSERLWEAASPKSTASIASTQPICDLVYDPVRLTIHTTIPNIPEPESASNEKSPPSPWSRVEALSVHSQILNTYTSTRWNKSELERTCKTSRGWWVVWMRLPHAPLKQHTDGDHNSFREAFLIRKASDYVTPAARKSSGRFGRDVSGSSASASAAWGPGKLAEGIGIDARQYIEGLLSLNR